MKLNLLSIIILLTISSCFGPGVFKEKKASVGISRSLFSAQLQFYPSTDFYNPLPSTLQVVFSSDVDMQSVSSQDFSVSGTGSCNNNNLFISSSVVDHTLTILLNTASCTSGDEISLVINLNGIFDSQGRSGAGSITQKYTLDSTNALTPVVNLTNGAVSTFPTNFTFVLDSSIDPTSVTNDTIVVTGTGSCPQNPFNGMSMIGTTVDVQLDTASCTDGDTITVTILTHMFQDLDGRSGVGTVTSTMTLDTQGVDASDITIDFNSGNYNPLPATLTISFPSDVDMSKILLGAFTVSGSGSCPGNTLLSLEKVGQHAILTLDTASCSNLDQLNFAIDMSQIEDYAGNSGTGNINKQLTLLNSIPSAPSLNYSSGVYAIIPVSVTASFTADINMNTVNSTSITATGTGSCQVNPIISVSNNLQVSNIALNTTGCQNGNEITLTIDMSKIENNLSVSGNGIIQRTFSLDSVGPANPIISVNTGSYSTLPASVDLTFGSDTDMSSVNLSAVSILGNGSCNANAVTNIVISGFTATANIDSASCSSGDVLNLNIDMTQIKDMVGNIGSGSASRNFILDTSTPSAPSLNFGTGTYQNIPSLLSFTFSNIDMSTISLADFTYQGNGSCSPSGIQSYSKNSSSFILNLDTASCSDADSIIISLNMTGIKNLAGTDGVGVLTYTYTKDISGPSSSTSSPLGGIAQTVPTSVTISLPADTDMQSVTLADFGLSNIQGCPTLAITGLSKVGTQAILAINSSSCTSGDSFSLSTLYTGIKDNANNYGVGSALVSYGLDTTGPSLPSINLASGTLQSIPSSLDFTFGADTDMSTITLADFSAAGTLGCPANALSSVSILGKVATLNLSTAGCVHGSKMDISLNMNGIADNLGNIGSGSIQRSFTRDSIGPATPLITTQGGSILTLPNKVIFTFESDVNMSTFDTNDFTIVGLGLCLANPYIGMSVSGQVATVNLNTAACLNLGIINVTVRTTGVQDNTGNSGTDTGTLLELKIL